jgi:outer membrane biosynthesis protein TonB
VTFGTFTRKRSPEVRRCYEAALAKDPSLGGKVTIAFAIQPGGGVSDVRVARTTFRSSAVPSCVAAVVRGWRTPFRPEEPVDVEYPIDFGHR